MCGCVLPVRVGACGRRAAVVLEARGDGSARSMGACPGPRPWMEAAFRSARITDLHGMST